MRFRFLGRTRTFDVEEAIGTATELFWRGYDTTSMVDLTSGLGIGPASFYHTFESKEAFFRELVRRYIASLDAVYEQAFHTEDTVNAVRTLLRHYADVVTDPIHTAGCLVVNSSPAVQADDMLKQWLASHREALRKRLQGRFAADRRAGRLPAGSSPKTMARLVLALYAGIAIEARAGASRKELHGMVECALQSYSQQTPSTDP